MTEPQTINHYIGQREVVARFKVALEAAWQDGTRLPHMLLVGPPGTGKTLLAHVAAREIGVHICECLAQVVNNPATLNGLLMRAEDKEIVFLDEVHELEPELQTLLYRAMEGRQVSIRQRDNMSATLPIKDITIIAATTDEFRLLGPLRDRFKLILPFQLYDPEALGIITQQRARMMGVEIDPSIPAEIAARAKGTPRLAIRLLEACHRYARSLGENGVTMDHFHKTVELEGIDPLGLGPDEQRYLKLLADRKGQPMRLLTIEAALGVHNRTIQSVIEPYLLRSGLIERHATGRIITETGLRHLGMLGGETVAIATGE